ncbi:MAG: hypothetical protein KDD61_01150 [Bdellovibrionales bacterium]|nr:hypothetical protein [Bdellovibrionales bacterium]
MMISQFHRLILLSYLLFPTCSVFGYELSEIQKDIHQIIKQAKLDDLQVHISTQMPSSTKHIVQIHCEGNKLNLRVSANNFETPSTIYYGLHKLGFLFPHPRVQIHPTRAILFSQCGKTFQWTPRFKYRGFHLHTQHPSEWVHGFFGEASQIPLETVRWMARNSQNVMQVQMIRGSWGELQKRFQPAMRLAKKLGLYFGQSYSFALQQQKSFKLIPFWSSLLGISSEKYLKENLNRVLNTFNPDFVTLELGTSEFTSTNFHRTLRWINLAASQVRDKEKKIFIKVHVSGGQHDPKYGNFNFLPQWAESDVGVLPHTVMFYGLNDKMAPIYGQKNFQFILDFIKKVQGTRPLWYYPETSYYIGLDIDIPLFLTDYLVARSDDMDTIEKLGVDGHITFSTGQELGYWLKDWTVALLSFKDYQGQANIGLRLLGEDLNVWREIVHFQTKYFKDKQLIQLLSTSNFQDEIPFLEQIHTRHLIRDLKDQPKVLQSEIHLLEEAIHNRPQITAIRNQELKQLLEVTWLRMDHALALRKTIAGLKTKEPKAFRTEAERILSSYVATFNRYPEAFIFQPNDNPTSYKFGYGWTARNLYYWEREERIVQENRKNPFFMNALYNPIHLLF